MLRVNLGTLLAERNLTASRLSKDTGISKTTLTSLVNNTGRGIQYDTIDTICNYLNVTPNDFFDYIPIDYSFTFSSESIYLNCDSSNEVVVEVVFDFFIDVIYEGNNKKTYELAGNFIGSIALESAIDKQITILLSFVNDEFNEFKEYFREKISVGHKVLFDNKMYELISKEVLSSLKEHNNFMDTDELERFIDELDISVTFEETLPF